MEYLHHYTTLQSLESILENETIRLRPLSTLDDMEEGLSEDCKAIGNFIFVSSWSGEDKEMIPMWYMYGDEYRGVRISLPKLPFKQYSYSFAEQLMHGIAPIDNKELVTDLPLSDINNSNYLIAPWHKDYQLKKIVYTDDQTLLKPRLWAEKDGTVSFTYGKMGLNKNDYWAFQKEWRYVLNILPIPFRTAAQYVQNSPKEVEKLFKQISTGKVQCPFKYYDLKLSSESLSQMIITLGPLMSESDKQKVHELVSEKNDAIQIYTSHLKGKIRQKNQIESSLKDWEE